MRVHFWGVRGSIPTPLTSSQIQGKISAVIQRIQSKDIINQKTRELFIDSLPANLYGTVGGNTTCVEVRLEDDTILVFDAGSGICRMGADLVRKNEYIREYHLFFTHFHWDHIQGLPFFAPQVYDPRCRINFYSPVKNFKDIISNQMRTPYFPVTIDVFQKNISYNELHSDSIQIGNATISWRRMKHPGGVYSYKIEEKGKTLIFSTDTELRNADFEKTDANNNYFKNVNTLILDSQYTLDEAIEKYDWGHSSYSLDVDFASAWNIKNLILFHHEPMYDDNKMFSILKSANWYKQYQRNSKLTVSLAKEGMEITL